jgi:methylated-DNA-[protein]-cysteine S-methyltransferase
MEEAYVHTPLGLAHITGDLSGIGTIALVNDSVGREGIPPLLEPACRQLREYFSGDRTAFGIRLNPEGTAFQKRVWTALTEIPFGHTMTYQELAVKVGDPNAVRAVAGANAQNPIWIMIPCHRVIGSDGSMRGYAWGIDRKKWLLNHESPARQMSLFREEPTAWSDPKPGN